MNLRGAIREAERQGAILRVHRGAVFFVVPNNSEAQAALDTLAEAGEVVKRALLNERGANALVLIEL